MLPTFQSYIAGQHLFSEGDKVLLAVSGGRDSVCMAHLMYRAGYPFAIAHCNFHLRPGECQRDQEFVRCLAQRYGVPFHTVDFDTRAYAAAHGMSIEEAARVLRYEWFDMLCLSHGYACVATAHHRDDSVETFFLNLFRGTGIAGLHGIRPRSGRVIRPLLCFSRADIDRYCAGQHLDYVEDSTNGELDARRNRIRLQLMPLLRELYPSVDATMQANIERLADVETIYRTYVDRLRQELEQPQQSSLGFRFVCYRLADLTGLVPQRTLVYELLQPYGFSAAVVDDMVTALPAARTGSRFLSPTHEAVVDRGRLVVALRREPQVPQVAIATVTPTVTLLAGAGPTCEYVDADHVSQPLVVRPWQRGDRFCPLGMTQQRLVSDFLKDCKLNLVEKKQVHLLVDADGRIVWVIGLRLDNRFRVTDTTRRVLRLSVKVS